MRAMMLPGILCCFGMLQMPRLAAIDEKRAAEIECIAAMTDDANLIAFARQGTSKILLVRAGKSDKPHTAEVSVLAAALAVSSDGFAVAVAGSDGFFRNRVQILTLGKKVECSSGTVFKEMPAAMALSPDGAVFSAGFSNKGGVEVMSASGKPVFKIPSASGIRSLRFSPDGKHLVVGNDDGEVSQWVLATGKPHWNHKLHRGEARCLSFSKNGHVVASGSGDGSVALVETATGKRLKSIVPTKRTIGALALSPDGTQLAVTTSKHELILWDFAKGKKQHVVELLFSDLRHCLCFSGDGKVHVACSGLHAKVDPGSGKVLSRESYSLKAK